MQKRLYRASHRRSTSWQESDQYGLPHRGVPLGQHVWLSVANRPACGLRGCRPWRADLQWRDADCSCAIAAQLALSRRMLTQHAASGCAGSIRKPRLQQPANLDPVPAQRFPRARPIGCDFRGDDPCDEPAEQGPASPDRCGNGALRARRGRRARASSAAHRSRGPRSPPSLPGDPGNPAHRSAPLSAGIVPQAIGGPR